MKDCVPECSWFDWFEKKKKKKSEKKIQVLIIPIRKSKYELAAGHDLTSLFVDQVEIKNIKTREKQYNATFVFLLAQVFDLKNQGCIGGGGGCTLMRFCLGLGESADDAVQEPKVLRTRRKLRKECLLCVYHQQQHVSQHGCVDTYLRVCVCVCVWLWLEGLFSDLPGLPDTSPPSKPQCRRPAASQKWQVWLWYKAEGSGNDHMKALFPIRRAVVQMSLGCFTTWKAWFHLNVFFSSSFLPWEVSASEAYLYAFMVCFSWS